MRRAVLVVILLGLTAVPLPTAQANPGLAFDLYPRYAPKDGTPLTFQVTVDGLLPSTPYDLRAGLRNYDANGTLREVSHYWSWEHADWRRSDWGSAYFTSDALGRWTGRVLVRANPASTYYDDALRGNVTAFLSVDYRESGGTYVGWTEVPVLLMDMDATTSGGTAGGWLHGYVLDAGAPVVNATVLVNQTASGLPFGIHVSQRSGALDYPLPATEGYYRVAVPEGGPYDLTVLTAGGVVAQLGGLLATREVESHASLGADPSLSERSMILTALYPDTSLDESGGARQVFGVDEYARVHNPSASAVDLSLWSFSDGVGRVYFPNGTALPPGASIFLASNATAFQGTMGFLPRFEYEVDSTPLVPDLLRDPKVPWFLNGGDVLRVQHRRHTYLIDALVYGDATYAGEGWSGPPAPLPGSTYVLTRFPDEASDLYPDTDTAADWTSLRRPRSGQSELQEATLTFGGSVTAFVSPDVAFPAVAGFLDNATTNLSVTLYQLEGAPVAQALADAAQRGVDVRLLLEGGPVGGISVQQKALTKLVADAGATVRFMIHDLGNDIHNRYAFLHAKYAVADGEVTLIGTENWKATGTPADPTYGNRGWGLILQSPALAVRYLEAFELDWNGLHRDIFPYDPAHPLYGGADPTLIDWTVPTGAYAPAHGALAVGGTFAATTLFAPDTSLSTLGGLLGLMDGATATLDIAQFYIHDRWRDSRTGEDAPNGYLEAALDASRRGVRVRILLDSYWFNVDEDEAVNNVATAAYVNGVALAEGLDLEARLVDLPAAGFEKLHTKGVIVDGTTTAVSSINWNRHSPTYNREAGVILESPEVAAYFGAVFDDDWGNALANWSQGLEVVAAEDSLLVAVGGERAVEFVVTNKGTVAAEVEMTTASPPAGWSVALDATGFSLAPSGYRTIAATVAADVPAVWDLVVTGRIRNSGVSANDSVGVQAAVMALEVTAPPSASLTVGTSTSILVRVRNAGEIPVNATLAWSALPQGWEVVASADRRFLLPGEEATFELRMTPSGTGTVDWTVSATIPDVGVSDSDIVTLQAARPAGGDLWWLLILIVVIIAAVLLYLYWRRRKAG